jgi:hypothetical protein
MRRGKASSTPIAATNGDGGITEEGLSQSV